MASQEYQYGEIRREKTFNDNIHGNPELYQTIASHQARSSTVQTHLLLLVIVLQDTSLCTGQQWPSLTHQSFRG
jgi:hypothetical protein